MRTRVREVVLAVAIVAGLVAGPACGPRGGSRAPSPTTTLVVENRSSYELTIYVWRSSERIRLGTARAVSDTRLRLPTGMVFGATTLRFQADPIGSARAPISQEILVREGDEVRLIVPPM